MALADFSRPREAIVYDDFGVDFSASDLSDLEAVRDTFLDAIRAKNRSQWLVGDIYVWAVEDGNGGEAFAQVLDDTTLSLRTAQNYGSVCSAFPKAWRKVPLSMSHYQAASALVNKQPTQALALLEQAYNGHMSREWVRTEAGKLLGQPDASVEVLLTWDQARQIFLPSQHLDLPPGTTRTLRFKSS